MDAHSLKDKLPRTWGPFFGRHGNFTAAQLAAMPLLLEGQNIILCAATAGGKTEAALAPLIERHLPASRPGGRLTILYLLPTRALINDLWRRLAAPCEALRVSIAVKTRDLNTFNAKRPAELLLTTPESLDSLLASQPRALVDVRAVVIDELHVFDGGVRGDQLRLLLNRLRQVRAYAAQSGDAGDDGVQYAALSATLARPEASAARYFPDGRVVEAGGGRDLAIESLPLEVDSPAALFDYLASFRRRGWRKALAFCNTRAEVEAYAAAARQIGSPFGEAVFVHYSNLERERRREIEQQFAQAEAALCFASSTLELGIDIGDIDVVLLIGAPGSRSGFLQRLGRAGRRSQSARAACFYRTPLERLLFQALAEGQGDETPPPFRPSVAIQQIFSLLKQSPTAALRPKPLNALFAGILSPPDLQAILDHLRGSGYLTHKPVGEWRAGPRLHRLVDQQAVDETALSLHSNIQNSAAGRVEIREQHSQRLVASVDRQWFERDVLTLEGRPLDVQWFDGEAMWVTSHRGDDLAPPLHYLSARQLLSFELAQQLPATMGLAPGVAPLVAVDDGWLLFHCLGDVYGQALLDLLGFTLAVQPSGQAGLALRLAEPLRALPPLAAHQVTRYLHDAYKRYESMLTLGAYQPLLPPDLRIRSVAEQFDASRFLAAVARMQVEVAAEGVGEDWVGLLA